MDISSNDIIKIEITTENAPKEDFECLMFDSMTEDLYLVSKNHDAPLANIYKFTPPAQSNQVAINMTSLGNYLT